MPCLDTPAIGAPTRLGRTRAPQVRLRTPLHPRPALLSLLTVESSAGGAMTRPRRATAPQGGSGGGGAHRRSEGEPPGVGSLKEVPGVRRCAREDAGA